MEVAAKGNGEGEVRRLQIIYFLSHVGHVEHPHLIRVHHLTRNGVYLRDVKRWLEEVRGKDMPEAFSWSYKRRYKNGYLWQDLMDDDLITPISDSEYVLKGSENPSIHGKKNLPVSRNDQQPIEVEDQHQGLLKEENQGHSNTQVETPRTPETSPEIFEGSPLFGSDRSTLTDDSVKMHEEDIQTVKQNTNEQRQKSENNSSPASFYSTLSNKKKSKNKKTKESIDNYKDNNNKNDNDVDKTGTTADLSYSSSSSSKSQFAKSKSYSSGPSNMLRNLMKCGAVDTNDAVLVPVNRADKTCLAKSVNMQDRSAAICQADKLGGSARIFGTPQNNQHQQQNRARKSFDGVTGSKRKNEFASTKPVSSAYKPVGGPTCSQCGKSFKPEKMHKHMKSCKGMKTLAKINAAVSAGKTPSQRSFNLSPQKSTSGYFLTN